MNTAEGLERAGFDVGGMGGDEDDIASGEEGEGIADEERNVNLMLFDSWMTLAGQDLGDVVQKWWNDLPPHA